MGTADLTGLALRRTGPVDGYPPGIEAFVAMHDDGHFLTAGKRRKAGYHFALHTEDGAIVAAASLQDWRPVWLAFRIRGQLQPRELRWLEIVTEFDGKRPMDFIADCRACLFENLLVCRAYRGRGIGGELLAIREREARELGFEFALALVHEANEGFQSRLTRRGWTRILRAAYASAGPDRRPFHVFARRL